MSKRKHATNHWLIQQATSICMIPLSLYLLFSFVRSIAFGNGYESAVAWLHNPLHAIAMAAAVVLASHHGSNGVISGIFEDYVHHKTLNMLGVVAVKISALALALAGVFSVAKIYFGV